MKRATLLLRLLSVHAIAILAFLLGDLAMFIAGTNRAMADLYLGMGGFVFGLLAIAVSLVAMGIVFSQPQRRAEWPWLFAHAAAVAAIVGLASAWMGTHIA